MLCVRVPPASFPTWKSDAWMGAVHRHRRRARMCHPFAGTVVLDVYAAWIHVFVLFLFPRISPVGRSNPRYFHAVWLHSRDAPDEKERSTTNGPTLIGLFDMQRRRRVAASTLPSKCLEFNKVSTRTILTTVAKTLRDTPQLSCATNETKQILHWRKNV